MPENLSPEGAAAEQVEDLRRNSSSGGGYSPHSTTGSSSRELRGSKAAEEEETTTEEETGRGGSDSDNSPPPPTTQLKQILAAAIKLAATISRQHSDRTLQIVTDLLIGVIDSTEFQQRVAQLIHLPFRPIVGPLMEKQLPWLRREMADWLHQFVHQATTPSVSSMKEHVKVLLLADHRRREDSSSSSSPDSPVLGVWQVFQPGGNGAETIASAAPTNPNTRKRRASASLVENSSSSSDGGGAAESSKRSSGPSNAVWMPPKVNSSGQQPQQQLRQTVSEMPSTPKTVTTWFSTSYPAPFQQQGDEEWANIHTMLNCILSMVEKTRRALGILQQRASDNQQQQKRRESPSSHSQQQQVFEASELRRQAGELIAQTLKATEDRVSQVKRKAEEAVHDVRRAAMAELQRALSAERLRAERLAAEARRQGAEEALSALGQHAVGSGHHQANKEVCWNCGRRANETCSGCNVARYCSTFCQHKHWEVHHKICGRVSQLMLAAAAAAAAGSAPSSAPADHHRSELAVGVRPNSPSSSHIGRSSSSSSKTPSPVQQPGPASYVH